MEADYFALLGERRRPYLDPERVSAKFRELSRSQHPDQPAGAADADFARLNQARQTLGDHKSRLGYLIGLEFPAERLAAPAEVPRSLAGWFAPVLTLLAEAEALLARKAGAPSALARALLAREEFRLRDRVETQLQQLAELHEAALAELREFDAHWQTGEPSAQNRLVDFHQRFSYLSRWLEQLRERLFQLGQ